MNAYALDQLLGYIWKANLSIILFWVLYRCLLHRWTFYKLNRWYWLTALVFSVLYPLMPAWQWMQRRIQWSLVYPESESQLQATPAAQSFSWESLVPGVFTLVAAVLLMRSIVRVFSIARLHKRSVSDRWNHYEFRRLCEPSQPFSFLRNTYVYPQMHPPGDLREIFEHESVHARQWHSLDCLLIEFLTPFFWYNPVMWKLRKALYLNLEFLTDQEVLLRGTDRQHYQFSLLRTGAGLEASPGSAFNYGSLKKRIAQMNKTSTAPVKRMAYLLVLPVGFLLCLLSAPRNLAAPIESAERVIVRLESPDTLVIGSQPKIPDTLRSRILPPARVVVRGRETNGKEPIIIVDGKPTSGVDISKISPEQIESISVYKGESAETKFGKKSRNGVIAIRLKK